MAVAVLSKGIYHSKKGGKWQWPGGSGTVGKRGKRRFERHQTQRGSGTVAVLTTTKKVAVSEKKKKKHVPLTPISEFSRPV
jgi:hypothetical protein